MIKNTFKIYLAFTGAFVLPILLANIYYIDDIGRATIGYKKWGVDGRPVADWVMTLINMSSRMADLAPLPLLISVALLSFSLSLYRKEFIGDGKWGVLIPLSFMANPAIISLFSYRFDVLTFSFAISVAFFMFILRIRNTVLDISIGSIFVVLVMGTYQALINIVVILIICELFKNISRKEDPVTVIKFICIRFAQVVIGSIFYATIILPRTFKGGHTTNHPGISNDILNALRNNAESYYHFASNNFYKSNAEYIIGFSALLCLVLAGVIIYSYMKLFKGALTWVVASGAIAASALSIPMTMGALLFLERPLGGVHLYMSVSGFYLLLATLIYYSSKHKKQTSLIILVPLLYTTTLIYAYGNALRDQDRINNSVINQIKQTISKSEINVTSVIYKGEAPRSEVAKNSSRNFPILNYTVIDYFWNWYWASAYLSMSGLKQNYISSDIANEYLGRICEINMVDKSQDFNSFYSDGVLIVDFSKTQCHK